MVWLWIVGGFLYASIGMGLGLTGPYGSRIGRLLFFVLAWPLIVAGVMFAAFLESFD